MAFTKISLEHSGDVAVIRLNDPAVLNAVGEEMAGELSQAFVEAEGSARAMILTGSGRAFSAGANLGTDIAPVDADGLPDAGIGLEKLVNPLMLQISRLKIPFISAVNGPAAGVGASLALAADFILAAENAYFLQAFARIGLVPDGGSSWLLMRSVGRMRAMEMMLMAERLPAAKALEWGLINRTVAADELEAAALEAAGMLAAGPTRSLALIRQLAWAAADGDWPATLGLERNLQREASRSEDFAEGVAAFVEKRQPRFSGA